MGCVSVSSDHLVVAIDGPAGSGKSTTARSVAKALDCAYLDTGALYRAMTWWMLDQGIDISDGEVIASRCAEPVITISTSPEAVVVHVDGADVSEAIREPVVAEAVSAVSRVPAVRTRLMQIQRDVIASGSIVVEGRDIGTVVAPDAGVKIFLTASPLARAQRRNKDYGQAKDEVKATMEALERRDLIDSTRDVSPLARADDAIEVDTSDLTLDQVIAAVLSIVASR